MTPATAGGPYTLPKEPSRGRSMALAAAVHAGLVLFLWIGTNWQTTPEVAVEAEVWDMAVQQAAPPPPPPVAEPEVKPEPEPTPPPKVEQPVAQTPPDIALERERKRKEDQKRAEELANTAPAPASPAGTPAPDIDAFLAGRGPMALSDTARPEEMANTARMQQRDPLVAEPDRQLGGLTDL